MQYSLVLPPPPPPPPTHTHTHTVVKELYGQTFLFDRPIVDDISRWKKRLVSSENVKYSKWIFFELRLFQYFIKRFIATILLIITNFVLFLVFSLKFCFLLLQKSSKVISHWILFYFSHITICFFSFFLKLTFLQTFAKEQLFLPIPQNLSPADTMKKAGIFILN